MSHQPPPDAHPQPHPQRPPTPPEAAQPPARSPRRRWIVAGAAAALILAVGIGIIGMRDGDNKKPPAGGPVKYNITMTFTLRAPKANDFTLTAKVTEKNCHGDAGCAVTWHPEVAYSGPAISSDLQWEITYDITSIDSDYPGRLINMNGTTAVKQPDQHVRIAKPDSKIVLKVTNVWLGHDDFPPGVDVHLNMPALPTAIP